MTLMKVTKFLERVNHALRGTDDDAPTPTDDDGKYWLDTYNRKKDEMYDDTTKNWRSAYDDDTAGKAKIPGTIAASVRPSFDLPDSFIAPAGDAYIIDTDGRYHYFDVVEPSEINRRAQAVYISGQNPQKLKFSAEIAAGSNLIGGTLYVPGYYRPEDIDPDAAGVEDEYILVDDPNWAVMAVAAQVAFNDITYEEKFGDLNGQSGVLWKNMVKKNRKRGRGNPKVTPYAVRRIRGVR